MNLYKKITAVVALSLGLATASLVPASAVPTCTVTITDSNITYNGTSNNDVICLDGNNDTVNLLEGNDWVIDNGSNNRIYLGSGDDNVDGSGGNGSIIDGGTGSDNIIGTPGIDTIIGGDGDDALVGGAGDDSLSGGSGNDTIRGDAGIDTIAGEAGIDNLDGGADNDNLNGGIGDDTLIGGDGNDTMLGGDGNDNLTGNAGDDNISGEAGNDIFDGGDGSDTLIGGTGDDTLVGGASGDVMNGGDGTDNLSGSAGDDSISGEAGNDTIDGGDGNDTLSGGLADDSIVGGIGNDTITGGDGNDNLTGSAGDDNISGEAGIDTIDGGDGNDTLTGGLANDAIVGGAGNDTLSGGDGNDNLSGLAGDDFIYGESGADTLAGNAGDDVLVGGADLDNLDGGFGLNTCDYTTSETKTSTCVYDDTAPSFTATSIGSSQLETGPSATALPISITVHDATGLGYARIICSVNGAGGYRYQAFDFTYTSATGQFTNNQLGIPVGVLSASGTARDVTISGTVTIRQGQFPGQYGCTGELQDVALNKATNLSIAGFEIVRTGSGFDDAAPTVSNVTFTKNPVDSGPSADQTTLHFELSDDTALDWGYFTCSLNSGNAQTRGIELGWTRTRVFDYNSSLSSQSVVVNSTTRGFTIPVTIKQATPPGNYQCDVWAQDTLYNRLDRMNVGTLVVERTGTAFDDNPPTVVSVTPSASTIDIGDSAKPFSITIHLTDQTAINWNYLSCSSGSQTLVNIGLGPNAVADYSTNHAFTTGTRVGNAQDLTVTANFLIPFGFTPGLYSCNMLVMDTNGHRADPQGVASFTVSRNPAGMPQSPTGLTYNPTTDRPTEGTLSWQAPSVLGSPELSDYEVQYSLDGSTWRTLTDGISATPSANLLGLTANTNYWFRVRGDNGGNAIVGSPGASWSNALSARTPVAIVPTAPRSPVVSAISSSSATISWTASAYNGGSNITAFVVETSRDAGNTWRVAPATNATSTNLAVTGLAPGTSYLIRVSARNAVGSSDFVTGDFRVLATLATLPLSLSASLATATSAALSWNLPASNGGDDITDYSVQFSSDNGAHWTSITHTATAVRGFDVTGLSKGVTYKFRVAAVNSIGIGAYSDVATLAVPVIAATAPTNLVSSSITSSSATVTWDAPSDLGGSPLTDYLVETSRDQGSSWSTISHNAFTTSGFSLVGLAPHTTYRVRFTARTTFGLGASATTEFTTLATTATKPLGLAASLASTTSVTLTWNLPASNGGDDITDYVIQFSSDNGTSWSSISHDASAVRGFDVTGLTKGVSYKFRVAAVNGIGTGAYSDVLTFVVPAVASEAPTNLTNSAVSASTASLAWSLPADLGGSALTDYQIEISRDGGSTWAVVSHGASVSRTFNLTGLAPGTAYRARVSAKTAFGVGIASATTSFRTTSTMPGIPVMAAVTNLTSSSVTLNWNLPSTNGGDDITDYKVEFSSNGGATWLVIAHDASAVRNFNVTGLNRATAYRFRVSAINSVGTSAATSPIAVTTLAALPASVSALTSSALSANAVTLRWTAPANNGGAALSDYVVETSRDGGNTWLPVAHSASTSTSITVNGLAPGTQYLLQVRAKNAAGMGPSSSLSITTPAILASQPLNLVASNLARTTLSLAWSLPSTNGGSDLTNYKIEVSSNNGSTWTAIAHTASLARAFDVTGLFRATTYKFRVSAINSVGVGAASEIIAVKTLSAEPNAPTTFTKTVGATTTTIGWAAPAENGGEAIIDYIVSISRDSGTSWTVLDHAASTKRSFAITGLTPGVTYPVRILAKNSIGNSGALEASFTTLPVVASAPLSLDTADVAGTTLRLNWLVPTNNGGASISNYLVQVSSNGTTFTTIQHPVSDSYGYNVTNLLAGTKYWFRVAAINSAGTSAFSNIVSAVTLGAVPSAPTSLAVSASTTYVSLSWQSAAVVGGSAIRNYIVEFSTDGGTTWRTVVKPVSTSRNLQVTGLTSRTTYKFRVTAVNDVGNSDASAVLSVTTK